MFGLMRVKTHRRLVAEAQKRNQQRVQVLEGTLYRTSLPPVAVKRWTDQGMEIELTSEPNGLGGTRHRFLVHGKSVRCEHCGKSIRKQWMKGG